MYVIELQLTCMIEVRYSLRIYTNELIFNELKLKYIDRLFNIKTFNLLNHTKSAIPGVGTQQSLYGEDPPRGLTLYPFIYHFGQKSYPFRIPSIDK